MIICHHLLVDYISIMILNLAAISIMRQVRDSGRQTEPPPAVVVVPETLLTSAPAHPDQHRDTTGRLIFIPPISSWVFLDNQLTLSATFLSVKVEKQHFINVKTVH